MQKGAVQKDDLWKKRGRFYQNFWKLPFPVLKFWNITLIRKPFWISKCHLLQSCIPHRNDTFGELLVSFFLKKKFIQKIRLTITPNFKFHGVFRIQSSSTTNSESVNQKPRVYLRFALRAYFYSGIACYKKSGFMKNQYVSSNKSFYFTDQEIIESNSVSFQGIDAFISTHGKTILAMLRGNTSFYTYSMSNVNYK